MDSDAYQDNATFIVNYLRVRTLLHVTVFKISFHLTGGKLSKAGPLAAFASDNLLQGSTQHVTITGN
jgi:hypothetical protein